MTLRLVNPSPVVVRLAAKLAPLGHVVTRTVDAAPLTWVLGADDDPPVMSASGIGAGDRILVLSWIGAHPDARAQVLRRLWALEEACRATALPALTLRLGPLAGPDSPLWRKLAHSKPAPRLARKLVHPVLESQVVDVIDRALRGGSAWNGWQEIGGADIMSLGECATLARGSGLTGAGEWEPDLEVLAEQRLIEPAVWARWSGIEPRPVATEAGRWAA